jgi:hypothetical protein
MFSSGQLIFAGFFAITFLLILVYSYRKDLKLHQKHYKGAFKILIGFLIFIGLLFVIKTYLR